MSEADERRTLGARDAARIALGKDEVHLRIAYAVAVLGPLALTVWYVNQRGFWGARAPLLCQVLVFSVAAALGGFWPALLATVLGVLSAAYFHLPPIDALAVAAPADRVLLELLAGAGLIVGVLGERERRDRRALAERERELSTRVSDQAAALESLLAHAKVGVAFFDREGRYERVNPWFAEILGQPVEWFRGKTMRETAPDEAAAVEPLVREVFATGRPHEPVTFETAAGGPSGGRRYWLTCFYPVRRAGGAVVSAGILAMEITAQKRSEEALRDSEERFRALFHANLVPLVRWHIDGRITDANEAFVRLVGYSLEELRRGALRWTSFIMPQRTEHLADLVVKFQETGRFGPEERDYPLRDGRRLPVVVGGAALPGHSYEGVAFVLDLSAQKRTEAALAEQLALTRTLTDNATAGLFLLDERGHCTFMNPAAEAMTGFRAEEIRDRPLHDWIHHHRPDDTPYPSLECPVRQAIMRGVSVPVHTDVLLRKDGERFPALCTSSPVHREGKVVSTVVEIRDITEQTRIEREREVLLDSERTARADAERANRQKDEFLAMISHELRTPLNAVLGWARLLRRPGMSNEQLEKGLATIERNAQLEAQIISDLLDISRIVSGKIHLERAPIDLVVIVEAALDVVRPAADAKGLTISVERDPQEICVEADPGRMQQIVWNLASNAVKFTPAGGRVDVSIRVKGGRVELSVSDTGQGIDPEFLPHVFERFRQADATAARRHGGLGLGLTITRHLVERHGGHVRAESKGPGKGARFTVDLPLAPRGCEGAAHEAERERDVSLKGKKLLAVDDEPDSLELTARVLEEHGATVITASSAVEALDRLRDERPNLVVSDIGMPGMDGYELIRHVRTALPAPVRDLPAIALTAFARPEDRDRALRAGFQAHLVKPIEPSELLATVANLVVTP
ncbi:MAG: PAS domain S-box protein [Minicystis sp.]